MAVAGRPRSERRPDRQRRAPVREGHRRRLLRHRVGHDDGRRELADHRHRHRSDGDRLRDHAGRGARAGRRPEGDHRQAGALRRSTRTITTITRSGIRCSGPRSRSSATRTRASGCSATRWSSTPISAASSRCRRASRRCASGSRTRTIRSRRRLLERQVANSLAYLEQVKEIKVTPPSVTLDRKMTLFRGGREIQMLYLRPRPHRHRRRRLPAEGEDRLHRRPDGVGHLLHGRRLRRRSGRRRWIG